MPDWLKPKTRVEEGMHRLALAVCLIVFLGLLVGEWQDLVSGQIDYKLWRATLFGFAIGYALCRGIGWVLAGFFTPKH